MGVLELTGLRKAYDGFAFGPLDLRVDDEVVAVLGPSGSGKTTLLSLVAGLVRPDEGTVTLDGRSLVGRALEDRRVGLVFQDGALFPHMTARENVAYATDDDARAADLASMLEIGDVLDRRPAALSGGERQRVALARTLAADPDALLLDEPLTSLDAPVRRRLRDEISGLFADLSVPIVYVTHDQRAATAIGDRVAVLRDGALEQVGTPEDVIKRPETPFVARFTGSENVVEATVTARDDDGVTLSVGDCSIRSRVAAPVDAPVGATVTACVRPSRLRLASPGTSVSTEGTRVANGGRSDGANGGTSDDANSGTSDDANGGPSDGTHGVPGTVRRWANEGDEYRIVVALDGADLELVANVRPDRFERLSVSTDAPVRVAVPPDHVHLIA